MRTRPEAIAFNSKLAKRNRIHLRPDHGRLDEPQNNETRAPDALGTDQGNDGSPVVTRRSNRVTRAPERLSYKTLGEKN
jgi:hypothetical protein